MHLLSPPTQKPVLGTDDETMDKALPLELLRSSDREKTETSNSMKMIILGYYKRGSGYFIVIF